MRLQGATPTTPDVWFRIRRFMKDAEAPARYSLQKQVPDDRNWLSNVLYSYVLPHYSTMDLARYW